MIDQQKRQAVAAEKDTGFDDIAMTLSELLGWIEFGCWVALGLTPILYYINGPAVSTDQLVMRWIVVCGSLIGAFGLAGSRVRSKYRRRIIAVRSDSADALAESQAESTAET